MKANDGFAYREFVGGESDGEQLLSFLARRYRHSSAAEWRERVESGQVLVDDVPGQCHDILRRGQALTWCRPPWVEPEAPETFTVLYRDHDVLAVAKPAGLPTLPGAGYLQRTLLHLVRASAPDAAPLHRLGRWTSGVVLFASSRASRAELARQWARKTVRKRYRALAVGSPVQRVLEVNDPIGPVPHPLLGTVHSASPTGRAASTRVTVLEQRDGSFLCDVSIATGRPHQIRIHLASAGHPLLGDPLYAPGGRPAPECRALPGDPGYLLHAAELTFRHPRTSRELTVSCVPPPPLRMTSRQVDDCRKPHKADMPEHPGDPSTSLLPG